MARMGGDFFFYGGNVYVHQWPAPWILIAAELYVKMFLQADFF